MAALRKYSIRKNRIKKGCFDHMELTEDGRLVCNPDAGARNLFLGHVDCGAESCPWGRLTFTGKLSHNTVVITRVAACDRQEILFDGEYVQINDCLLDASVAVTQKKRLFERLNGERFVSSTDMLLYTVEGRYLWIYLEILGMGSTEISDIQITLEGDNFMYTFPEIYQERNSFFHRYMSIFSSIYNDFQDDIDSLPRLLDPDTAPSGLLTVYAGWLGIDIGEDLLEEDKLRRLLKEAYKLNRHKGTVWAIRRIIEIVLEQEAIIIEKNRMRDRIPYLERDTYDRLYGDKANDVTILIRGRENEKKKAQLAFLLNQFLPLRARISLVFLGEEGRLDSYCYLDMNARIHEFTMGNLDEGQRLDGSGGLM